MARESGGQADFPGTPSLPFTLIFSWGVTCFPCPVRWGVSASIQRRPKKLRCSPQPLAVRFNNSYLAGMSHFEAIGRQHLLEGKSYDFVRKVVAPC